MNRENKRKTFEKGYYKTHACRDAFTCKVCGRLCTPESAGSDHRNHWPNCLSSLHVDIEPGDRASDCGGIMEPVAVWVRKGGDGRPDRPHHRPVHAGKERFGRVGGGGRGAYISVHVPQLECGSPDAAYINDELNDIYAAHFREYEAYEEAGQPGGEYPQIGVNWDAYWYGDCVSLVVSSYYGGTDPIYSQGWCFDFAAGHKLSVTELLMRRGLDPDETQLAVYRADIQTFDRNMVQQEYYDSLRENGMLSEMRADTLRDNGLENLTVLLKNENTVTLVAGCHTTAGSG